MEWRQPFISTLRRGLLVAAQYRKGKHGREEKEEGKAVGAA